LEEGVFHRVLVTLDLCELAPWQLLICGIGLLDGLVGLLIGAPVIAAVIVAQMADAAILRSLKRRRISFGPSKVQWLVLAASRLFVGYIASLLARFVSGQIGVVSYDVAAGVLIQLAGLLLVVRGFHIEPRYLTISSIELGVPALAPGRAIRLLHVADVHVERLGVREQSLIEMSTRSRPDAILFTGDFLNLSYVDDAQALLDARALWTALSRIAPVFAVSGSPPVDPQTVVAQILQGLPVRWLRDELEPLPVCDAQVWVAGVTCTHDPVADGARLRTVISAGTTSWTVAGGHEHPFTILLHHSPDLAPQAAELGAVDLYLAGHTHGGQVRVPGFGALITSSLYGKALEMGLYQLREMLLFVSRGVGLEGKGAPRVRLNCPPQLMLFVLHGPERGLT
jgi:predicted MPP superfamily phosphohydrolase